MVLLFNTKNFYCYVPENMGDQLAVVKKLLVLVVITSVFQGLTNSTAATTLAMAAAIGKAIFGKLVDTY